MMMEKYFDEYTIKTLNIREDEDIVIEKRSPYDLINAHRLDVIAKYMYLLFNKRGIHSDLAFKVYKSHIDIFSEGKFYEPGSSTKNSFDDFLEEFQSLFVSIKKNGFDKSVSYIPVGNDDSIINGGHRLAISLYLDTEVDTVKLKSHSGGNYGYCYFKKRQMPALYLDFLALNYVYMTKKQVYVVCLWPVASQHGKSEKVEHLLSSASDIIYKKSAFLNRNGMRNFMLQIYGNQEWIGNDRNNYSGVYSKVDECYAEHDTIFYIIEGIDLKTVLKIKNQIRSIFNIGKHAIHITDTREEAIEAANLILNDNSVYFMNNGNPNPLNHIISEYKNQGITSFNTHIMAPKATLAIMGEKTDIGLIDIHQTVDYKELDLEYDIRNFFYYRGVKFFSPSACMLYLSEEQQKRISKIIKNNKTSIKTKIIDCYNRYIYYIKRSVIQILRKTRTLNLVSKIMSLHKDR